MPDTTPPGFDRALNLFHFAAEYVPAYAKFLADRSIDHLAVLTPADFEQVPPVTKTDYFQRYPRQELMIRGNTAAARFWSYSSGSTGQPGYWPRDGVSHAQGVALHRRILRRFDAHERSTLVVVSFAMGNWVGGTYTVSCVEALAAQGFPISVVTPGQNLDAVRADIATLGPGYEQVVLVGYPPFVLDVLDGAGQQVLGQDLKILIAGENISEHRRDRLLRLIGKTGRHADTCSIYGTADAGMMGHETPTTIAVRRLAAADPVLRERIFGTGPLLPTFVEYDPRYRYTESDIDGRLLFTAAGPMPLVRYRINDEGTVLTASRLANLLRGRGHDLRVRVCSPDSALLVLHGRSDVAATFYAVKIPIDGIRAALADPRVEDQLTGKFLVSPDPDGECDELRLRVELRAGISAGPGFAALVTEVVTETLSRISSEYRELMRVRGAGAEPIVTPLPHGGLEFGYDIKHTGLCRAG